MRTYRHVKHLWDDSQAATLSGLERLVYRSNLLGSDQRITNTGGGNTSSKINERDPLTGKEVEVLWVKGSGGDLRTSTTRQLRVALSGKTGLVASRCTPRIRKRGPKYRNRGRDGRHDIRIARSTSTRAPHPLIRRCIRSSRSSTSTTCTPTRSSPWLPRNARKS